MLIGLPPSITWVPFQAKAYLVFALLFGYCLTLLLASADRKGYSTGAVYGRRLAALLALGVLLGLLALDQDDLSAARTGLLDMDEQLRTGGLVQTTVLHAQVWPAYQGTMLVLQCALVGSMVYAGLLAGRHRLLQRVDEHLQFWRRIRTWGLVLGPLQAWSGRLAFAPGASQASYVGGLSVQYLSAPLMSAGLVALIALLPARSPAALLEPESRMSLTVYLGESALLARLGSGWGLGLLGLGPLPPCCWPSAAGWFCWVSRTPGSTSVSAADPPNVCCTG